MINDTYYNNTNDGDKTPMLFWPIEHNFYDVFSFHFFHFLSYTPIVLHIIGFVNTFLYILWMEFCTWAGKRASGSSEASGASGMRWRVVSVVRLWEGLWALFGEGLVLEVSGAFEVNVAQWGSGERVVSYSIIYPRIQQNPNASGLVLAEFLREAWIPVGLLQVMRGPNDNLIDYTAAQWLKTKILSTYRICTFLKQFCNEI